APARHSWLGYWRGAAGRGDAPAVAALWRPGPPRGRRAAAALPAPPPPRWWRVLSPAPRSPCPAGAVVCGTLSPGTPAGHKSGSAPPAFGGPTGRTSPDRPAHGPGPDRGDPG